MSDWDTDSSDNTNNSPGNWLLASSPEYESLEEASNSDSPLERSTARAPSITPSGSHRASSSSSRDSNSSYASASLPTFVPRSTSREESPVPEYAVGSRSASTNSYSAFYAPVASPSASVRRNTNPEESENSEEEDISDQDHGNAQAPPAVTAGDGHQDQDNLNGKKRIYTNAERLEAVHVAKTEGIYTARILFECSQRTVKRWLKCEDLIGQMDPNDTKYYVQFDTVPPVLIIKFGKFLFSKEELWPLGIKPVIRQFRLEARKLKLPHAHVPGVKAFLRTFKMKNYQFHGAFMTK